MFDRQTNQLLFPKILWNRPISRSTAGRLFIVGGHKGGVAILQGIYQVAQATGIGALTLFAPDVLRSQFGSIPELSFGPSTHSGSLAKAALAEILEISSHADTTLIGADASNNSETAILLESFVSKSQLPVVIVDDALEIIAMNPETISHRSNTLVILTMQQLFKLAGKLQLPISIDANGGLSAKVRVVNELWSILKVGIALVGPDIIIKIDNQVSVTTLTHQPTNLMPTASAILAVFYTQNPSSRYEGLTTGAYLIKETIETASGPTIAEVCLGMSKVLGNYN